MNDLGSIENMDLNDYRVAILLTNYNMPERADALAEYIHQHVKWPYDLILIDNGSDIKEPSKYTKVRLEKNVQTTGGWLAGLQFADAQAEKNGKPYFAYWFMITSAEFPAGEDDPLTPCAAILLQDSNAVAVHPALTQDSTTVWKHLMTLGGSSPRRTWMIDNIASLYRADWFNRIGRFDPALYMAHGIDLETCWKARKEGRSIWIHEGALIKKVTNIGYTMNRMNMQANERVKLAKQNMDEVLIPRYGENYWDFLMNDCPIENQKSGIAIPLRPGLVQNKSDMTEPGQTNTHSETKQSLSICLVSNGYPPQNLGGVEVYTHALAKNLQNQGHSVHVICPEWDPARSNGTIRNDEYEGVSTSILNIHPTNNPTFQFDNEHAGTAFSQYLLKHSFDVVHFQHLIGFSAAALEQCSWLGIPTLFTMHDGWYLCEQIHFLQSNGQLCEGPSSVDKCVQCFIKRHPESSLNHRETEVFSILSWRREYLRKCFQNLDALLVPSQYLKQSLEKHYGSHLNLKLFPLGIQTFNVLEKANHFGKIRFGYVGSFSFAKGFDLLMDAFDTLEDSRSLLDLHGNILDHTLFNRYMEKAQSCHEVQYHGPFHHDQLSEIFQQMDVLVMTSRTENYPTVLREAVFAGVPVIAPDLGGVPEIVQDGVNGFLFKPGDPIDLALKMRKFVEDPTLISMLEGQRTAIRTIDEDACGYEAIYRQILQDRAIGNDETSPLKPGRSLMQDFVEQIGAEITKNNWGMVQLFTSQQAAYCEEESIYVKICQNEWTKVLFELDGNSLSYRKPLRIDILDRPALIDVSSIRVGTVDEAFYTIQSLHDGRIQVEGSAKIVDIDGQDFIFSFGNDPQLYLPAIAKDLSPQGLIGVEIIMRVRMMTPQLMAQFRQLLEEKQQQQAAQFDFLVENQQKELLQVKEEAYRHTQQMEERTAAQNEAARFVRERVDFIISQLGTSKPGLSDLPESCGSYDILIPIYNAFDHVKRCVESVIRHTDSKHSIFLLDDASPDPRILPLLEDFAAQYPQVKVIPAKKNLGFIGNINRGLYLSQNSVILLNSDTEVTPGWLDRMDRCQASSPSLGIICPLSNNATILSVPEINKENHLPADLTPESFAQLVAQCSTRSYPRIPTAVGFCMLITRKTIEQVGLLDPIFGLGYGEENDFCMRAWMEGIEIAACDDAYVHHYGEASFSQVHKIDERRQRNKETLEARWPNYNRTIQTFCYVNPLREIQERIAAALAQRKPDPRPHVLQVIHSYDAPGGTELHTKNVIHGIKEQFRSTVLVPGDIAGSWMDMNTAEKTDDLRVVRYRKESAYSNEYFCNFSSELSKGIVEQTFANFVAGGDYEIVHFQHLGGWSSFILPSIAKALGKKVVVSVHDFFLLCPEYNLILPENRRCGKIRACGFDEQCIACLAAKRVWARQDLNQEDNLPAYLEKRYAMISRMFQDVDIIVVPSRLVQEKLQTAFGDVVNAKIRVIPHGVSVLPKSPRHARGNKLKVGFLGNLTDRKGAYVLLEAAKSLKGKAVRFEVFGGAPDSLREMMNTAGIRLHGAYQRDDLPKLLENVDVILIPSIWDETFGLTLSEAQMMGIPVIASDSGAMKERIDPGKTGYLFPTGDAEALAQLLLELSQDEYSLNAVVAGLSQLKLKTINENVTDYSKLYQSLLHKGTGGQFPMRMMLGFNDLDDTSSHLSLKRGAEILEKILESDDLVAALELYRPLLRKNVIAAIDINIEIAQKSEDAELVDGLIELKNYIQSESAVFA